MWHHTQPLTLTSVLIHFFCHYTKILELGNLLRKEVYLSQTFGGWDLDSDDSFYLVSSEALMEDGITVTGHIYKRSHGESGSQKCVGAKSLSTPAMGGVRGKVLLCIPGCPKLSVLFPKPQRAGITSVCHHGQLRLPLFVRTNWNPIKSILILSDDGTLPWPHCIALLLKCSVSSQRCHTGDWT